MTIDGVPGELTNVANFQRCLGDPARLKIFCLLMNEELCVREIQRAFNMGQSRVSQHLTELRKSGLVKFRRDGKWVLYGVDWGSVARSLERMDRLFRDPEGALVEIPEVKFRLDRLREDGLRREKAGATA